MTKIDVRKVFADHYRTLGDASGYGKGVDFAFFYLLPILCGCTAYWILPHGIPKACRDSAVVILSIAIPLSFTVLATLYQLRDRPSVVDNSRVIRLLEDLYHNTVYGILICVVGLSGLFIADLFDFSANVGFSGLFILMAFHLLLTTLMLIKRFNKLMEWTLSP